MAWFLAARPARGAVRTLALLCALTLLAACTDAGPVQSRPFSIGQLMKSDADMVADLHLSQSLEQLRQLMTKLYRRNPVQWRQAGHASLEVAVQRLFSLPPGEAPAELADTDAIAMLQLAFTADYASDRVLAFVAGLRQMTYAAYGNRGEQFWPDELDPQSLYNCARNYEIAAWKLRTLTRDDGLPWLFSTELLGPEPNLSFERLFGKLIGQQDIMARIVADSTNRRIKTVVQSVASAVFLPI